MSFSGAAADYDRFMGRYSAPLAAPFADFAGVAVGMRALDVGCGPGALTGELVARVGVRAVSAVDPSRSFVAAAAARHPGVDVQLASAESLPHPDQTFDISLAQLVVHFMRDPVAGLRDMARVTKQGGVVAACVWDHAGGQGPLGVFWAAARTLNPEVRDESDLAGAREGHLRQLFDEAGLADVTDGVLVVDVVHDSFDEWWEPFTLGVGPAGSYVARLEPGAQISLQQRCREMLPPAPFTVSARTWVARGVA